MRKAMIVSISMPPRLIEGILPILEREAAGEGDLLQLPESCLGDYPVIEMGGEEMSRVSRIAKKYGKYIAFPVFRSSDRAKRLNTSVLFGRDGEIIGTYDKVYPYWGEFDLDPPATPGDDAPVFETDFGKIGFAICFDANYPEVWKRLSLGGAELVLWSSAYSAGTSLQAHALNHNYTIISSTWIPDCVVYDINGKELFYGRGEDVMVRRTEVDLDRCIFHENFNEDKLSLLLAEQPRRVEVEKRMRDEQWIIIRSAQEGVSAREVCAAAGMEELRAYKLRSRSSIDAMREI